MTNSDRCWRQKAESLVLDFKGVPCKGETSMNQLFLCSVGITERAFSKCPGSQRVEPGSDEEGRECRAGQIRPGEMTFELHVRAELELRAREPWVKAWRRLGACQLVGQTVHLTLGNRCLDRWARQPEVTWGNLLKVLQSQWELWADKDDQTGL